MKLSLAVLACFTLAIASPARAAPAPTIHASLDHAVTDIGHSPSMTIAAPSPNVTESPANIFAAAGEGLYVDTVGAVATARVNGDTIVTLSEDGSPIAPQPDAYLGAAREGFLPAIDRPPARIAHTYRERELLIRQRPKRSQRNSFQPLV